MTLYGDQLAAGWRENIKCGLSIGSVCNGGYSKKKIRKVVTLCADCPNRILLIKESRTRWILFTSLSLDSLPRDRREWKEVIEENYMFAR